MTCFIKFSDEIVGLSLTIFSNFSIKTIALRFFNIYGPRSRTSGAYGAVFGVFLAQKLNGQPFTVVGDGTQTRDFTFVTDVADAFISAAESNLSGEAFNSQRAHEIGFINEIINKKRLTKAVNEAYMIAGNAKTVIFLDKLKDLGFAMATKSGVSIAISDILIPDQKDEILLEASIEVDSVKKKFDRHVLTCLLYTSPSPRD